MKNSFGKIIIIVFISVIMFLNNPGIEVHRTAVFEKVQEKVNTTVPDMLSGNEWVEQGKKMGLSILKTVINNAIVRDDYLLFSVTKVIYPSDKAIGIGILNRVFIFTDFDPAKENATTTQNEIERFETEAEAKETSVAEVPPALESENISDYSPGYYYAGNTPEGRIFFHNKPDVQTKRNAFLVEGDEVYVEKVVSDFGYVEFTNSRGQVTKGWVKMNLLQEFSSSK